MKKFVYGITSVNLMDKNSMNYHAVQPAQGSQNMCELYLCGCMPMFRIGKVIRFMPQHPFHHTHKRRTELTKYDIKYKGNI